MTKRCAKPRNGPVVSNENVWNLGTLVNVGAIVLSFLATGAGFYFLTNYRLSAHDTVLQQQERQITDEDKERLKNRDEYLDRLGKINDSIATLNTHAAVQDENSKQISNTLDRISRQLETATIRPSAK